jgi:hypothetical protein
VSSEAAPAEDRPSGGVVEDPVDPPAEGVESALTADPAVAASPFVGPVIAPADAHSFALPLRRAVAILLLFGAGLAAGIAGYQVANRPPALPNYPPLPAAAEPAVAHDLVGAIAAGDAKGIADRLAPGTADALSTALQPIVEVTGVTYLGTVEQDGRQLAGYVVRGRDQSKTKAIVGIVFDVADGQIVGINQ